MMEAWLDALTLSAGYNTRLVTLGSLLLGAAAGMVGSHVLLRKRALISDAVSHATLPGLAAAFILIALVQGDGRWLPGLLLGAAASAALGLAAVQAMSRHTRLGEDSAIGAVLSVFFGLGVVLLTVIQAMPVAGQAGLSGYLVGATAGMLASEAYLLGAMALGLLVALVILRRTLLLLCFDPEHAWTQGVDLRRADAWLLGLLLAVTVVGLRVTGLILIVALTIIPPVTARFWTDRPHALLMIAAVAGALAGYLGVTLSSVHPRLPSGALVVLAAFALFLASLLIAPRRGLLAHLIDRYRFVRRVHCRQGLLALARGEAIFDPTTLRILHRLGHIRRDGLATAQGRAAARDARHEERLWTHYRHAYPEEAAQLGARRLEPISRLLPPDLIDELERRLPPEAPHE